MKVITAYEAVDGQRFFTEADALRHERALLDVRTALQFAGLRDVPTHNALFRNGDAYLQQPPGARQRLVNEAKRLGLSRDSDRPWETLLSRLYCLDERDREWQQPYFANNPTLGAVPL